MAIKWPQKFGTVISGGAECCSSIFQASDFFRPQKELFLENVFRLQAVLFSKTNPSGK
jgi:hypothetical protein